MEANKEKLRQLFVTATANFKMLETEILALRVVIASLQKMTGVEGDVEPLVEMARKTPNVQAVMNAKYDAPLARCLEQFDKGAEINDKILEYLRSWKPQGPAN